MSDTKFRPTNQQKICLLESQRDSLKEDNAVLAAEIAKLREVNVGLEGALDEMVVHCASCGGAGKAYTHIDETEVGQMAGSSGIKCPECSRARSALNAAKDV